MRNSKLRIRITQIYLSHYSMLQIWDYVMSRRAKDTIAQMLLPMNDEPKYKWLKGFHKDFKSFETRCRQKFAFIGFDVETKGYDPYHPQSFVISAAVSPASSVAFATVVQHNDTTWDERTKELLTLILSDENVTLVGHNIKFDLNWVKLKLGIDVKCQVFDTMLAQYFLNENLPASLGDLISNHLKEEHHKGMVNTSNLEAEHIDDVLLYNAKDAEAEVRLLPVVVRKLEKLKALKQALLGMRVIKILHKMECRGVAVDIKYAKKNKQQLFNDAVRKRLELREKYGTFDPDSPDDLARVLYSILGLHCERYTDTGKQSTDYNTLVLLKEQCNDAQLESINQIISYKKDMKLLSGLYKKVIDDAKSGRIHPKYNLGKQYGGDGDGGTVTGRLSGNMQQVPRGKEHKGIFVPSDGYVFVDGDFSQLELRVVAFLAQEPVMIKAFKKGWDIHTAVMSDLLKIDYDELVNILEDSNNLKHTQYKELRVAIKRINFGIVYGVSAPRLQILLKVEMNINWSVEQCQDLIDRWLAKYSKVADFLREVKNFVCDYKFVKSIFGQRRRLPDAQHTTYRSDKEDRSAAARAIRQAQNFVVQSPASWIMLIGMILVDEYLQSRPELDGSMVIQVHDSGTWEIKKGSNDLNQVASDIQHIMEHKTKRFMKEYFGINFNVPLRFETKIMERWQ